MDIRLRVALAFGLACLAGCDDAPPSERAPKLVDAKVVEISHYSQRVKLTGVIQARTLSDLAFRVGGRVEERLVDVGDHVEANQILARLDTKEQQANLDSAQASVEAAEARLKQVTASFDRQKALLEKGFTTRKAYDQAEEDLRTAQGALDGAKSQVATAKDVFSYTSLRAPAAGIITARGIENGQVVQTASTAFSIALDGPRDAVFDVYEAVLAQGPDAGDIAVSLVTNPDVKAVGRVREVSPTIDPSNGAVRVKLGIDKAPPEMTLGSVVSGIGHFKPRDAVILPWTALASANGKPAVWLIDPASRTVSMKPIEIADYATGEIVVGGGLRAGDIAVTAGGQQLRPGERVAYNGEQKR